jgi:23S rRNA pseudouridine2605 synthase
VHAVTTVNDPQGRKTVLDLLPEELRARRLFPVGRLDYMSEGLLLLTNDGEVTLRLTHPSYEHAKKYEVLVRERVTEKALATMRQGMRLKEGERLAPVEVEAAPESSGATLLRLTLRQGVNRQIRRMCRDLGLTILRLRRVELGPLRLGSLAPGKWRALTESEIQNLKSSLGLS